MIITKELIDEFVQNNAEPKYKEFFSRLTNTRYVINGIRIPLLKKYAKVLAKAENVNEFLSWESQNYEQLMLIGLVIAYAKESDEVKMRWIDDFVKRIDDWGVCDTCSCAIKIKSLDYRKKCLEYACSQDEWIARWGIVNTMLYSKDDVDAVVQVFDNVKCDAYYVNMALAWFMQSYIAYDPIKAKDLVEKIFLNDAVRNMAIRKIKDSYKISQDDKMYFAKLLSKEKN